MKTVIFDLDGTLADTSGDLIAAANACFADMGQPAPLRPERDQRTAFGGGRAMLRLGFTRLGGTWAERDIDAAFPDLLTHYGANIDRFTTLYTGVLPMLDALAEAGYGLGVCTNKPEGLADLLLQKLGLRARFGALVGADTLPQRKPDPRPLLETIARLGGRAGASVLVGDTITDQRTARAANLPSILVSFGPGENDVAALGPDAVLSHFEALPALVDRLLGG